MLSYTLTCRNYGEQNLILVRTVFLFRAITCTRIIKTASNAALTSSFCRQRPDVQHHIMMASASPPLTKCWLSAENASACTQPLCPVSTNRQRPVWGFHNRTVLSHEPDACQSRHNWYHISYCLKVFKHWRICQADVRFLHLNDTYSSNAQLCTNVTFMRYQHPCSWKCHCMNISCMSSEMTEKAGSVVHPFPIILLWCFVCWPPVFILTHGPHSNWVIPWTCCLQEI